MPRGRRTVGWVGSVGLLLIAVWGLYRLFEKTIEAGPGVGRGQLLLPAMSLAIVILALALAGLLIRNLVRLIVDRKRGILGARLRTKLVFFVLVLTLLPATILFVGSAQIIKQTVEAILLTPMEVATRQYRDLVDRLNDHFRDQCDSRATRIAEEIERGGYLEDPRSLNDLYGFLERWRRQADLQLVQVIVADGVLAESEKRDGVPHDSLQLALREKVSALAAKVAASGVAAHQIDYLGEGLLVHAAAPAGDPTGGATVAVAMVVPARLSSSLEGLDMAQRAYAQFRAQRRELVQLYLTLIGLIFLVVAFSAVWIGFYLSRRITGPLQELAAASREISAGNLAVRVREESGDEMGMLVDAFNEMAAELQESREVITHSTAELRLSNRALDERRRYIETLLANLSTAVISLDPVGSVTTANPAVREILGVSLAPRDPAPRVFRAYGLEPLAEFLEQGMASKAEQLRRDLVLQRGSGTLHVSVQLTRLSGAGGGGLGTLIMVEDLTELLRAQKAAAWREIARRIAHEIKNPLTPIQLAAQRLRKKFASGADDLHEVVPAATDAIEREVGALKQLVDEFSRFARMPEVHPREVEFHEVVATVLDLYKGLPHVEWEVQMEPSRLPVTVDPEQMRRVLINLIDNAVAAMEGKGTISLAARLADGRLRIDVADSGPGILPADRDKMFSPYFSTKKRGTGLGLAIVHRVVTDHHGTIRVEDHESGGARFVIEIPTADAGPRIGERDSVGS